MILFFGLFLFQVEESTLPEYKVLVFKSGKTLKYESYEKKNGLLLIVLPPENEKVDAAAVGHPFSLPEKLVDWEATDSEVKRLKKENEKRLLAEESTKTQAVKESNIFSVLEEDYELDRVSFSNTPDMKTHYAKYNLESFEKSVIKKGLSARGWDEEYRKFHALVGNPGAVRLWKGHVLFRTNTQRYLQISDDDWPAWLRDYHILDILGYNSFEELKMVLEARGLTESAWKIELRKLRAIDYENIETRSKEYREWNYAVGQRADYQARNHIADENWDSWYAMRKKKKGLDSFYQIKMEKLRVAELKKMKKANLLVEYRVNGCGQMTVTYSDGYGDTPQEITEGTFYHAFYGETGDYVFVNVENGDKDCKVHIEIIVDGFLLNEASRSGPNVRVSTKGNI